MESNKEFPMKYIFVFMTSVLKSISLIKTALDPAFPLPGISKLSWIQKKIWLQECSLEHGLYQQKIGNKLKVQ